MERSNSFLTTPVSILLSSFVISISILMHGGIIKVGGAITQPVIAQPAPSQQPAAALPQVPTKVDVAVGHFPIKGSDKATVSVIEFADLRCPFCEKFFTQVEPNLIKDYVDTNKVKFAFRQYAFLGPASTVAANAAECANDQGKFWQFHDYLYQNQPDESDTLMYTTDKLTTIAGNLGMNSDQFSSCLSANKFSKNVTDDFNAGQQAGVNGTPATFINGKLISGACPYATFDGAIKAELAGKSWTVNNCQLTAQ